MSRIKALKNTLIEKSQSPFVRSLGVYTLLNFFLKGISFLITPLFTNYISPSEFGNLNLYLNSINLISPLIILSTNSIAVDYFKVDKKELGKQISTYFLFSFAICLAIACFITVFHTFLAEYFKFNFIYIIAVPFICFFNLIIDTGFIFFRNENMLKKITFLTVFRTILEIGLSIFFIIYLLKGAEGRIMSMIIATSIAFIISFFYVYRMSELRFIFNFDYIRKEFKFWLSTMVGFLFISSFQIADKYIVKHFCTADELGQYGLATQFGFIIWIFSLAINSAFHPILYKSLSNKTSIKEIKKKILMLIFILILISISSLFFINFVYRYIVNSQFANSWQLVYLVIICYFLWSVISLFYGFIIYYKLNWVFNSIGLFSILVFIPLEIVFTYKFHIIGIFTAQFICLLSLLIYLLFVCRKKIIFN